MSCEPSDSAADAAAPKLTTLEEAIDRDGVPATYSAKQRRLMDIHVTGYPGVVNHQIMPKRTTAVTDLSSIDPLQYRKAHTIRNNNAASYTEKEDTVVDMLTTTQFAQRMTSLGLKMREEKAKNPQKLFTIGNLAPRGYHSRYLAPPFDERSTYRWDYCQWESDGYHDTVRRERLATYDDEWAANEKADVAQSMKVPYLTMPVSSDRLKDKSTIYRKDYMTDATPAEFRTQSYKTNLEDLGTTFAYSAYGVDDPRREVRYDASVAAHKTPRSVLEKTYSPRASFLEQSASGKSKAGTARDELDRLCTMRRDAMQRSAARQAAAALPDVDSQSRPVVIPGIKGSGYRRAPKDNDEYVYLPRDHFCYQAVDNF